MTDRLSQNAQPDADEQHIFMCSQHQFVCVVRSGEINCRNSPGRREHDCAECDRAVDDAFMVAGLAP